ncbi:PilN domain-containing protein [Alysiella filiformis]|uniref:Type IV pilus assembly protein PilN n=1 Tax=Alysiella filiformis DSM 16848 TaxID=1120981 RepID=A0A286EHC4_9NEIS|nr:PilN domain-containing protein [Alysiella filiformis]QMT32330.1 PilN domain-containing protein [Alysiella filiformis]UBQ56750.1 PilN domain-containing protein [Alysiella filiformis DSM 16848]SOD70317.1 type IV pilus assembly protein PilN [Alysiella filiformis DSM 16848]
MNLIKVNLLPYREMKEAALKKHFQMIMAVGAIIGVVAAGLIYLTLSQMLEAQNQRNATLEEGLAALDKDLVAIKALEQRKHDFLLRKSKVEELDNKRFEGARIIDSLNQLVPDGVYLLSLQGTYSGGSLSNDYTITGRALTESKVAMFMEALPSTGVFNNPILGNIRQNEEAKAQEFTLNTKLIEQKLPAQKPAPANAASGVAQPQ